MSTPDGTSRPKWQTYPKAGWQGGSKVRVGSVLGPEAKTVVLKQEELIIMNSRYIYPVKKNMFAFVEITMREKL